MLYVVKYGEFDVFFARIPQLVSSTALLCLTGGSKACGGKKTQGSKNNAAKRGLLM